MKSEELIELTERYAARNYGPLDVVIRSAEGVYVFDVEGKRYVDMLSGYSALNFGHRHPRLIAAAKRQLDKLTLSSRAFYSEEFALLCSELAALCRKEKVLLMNSGAEAVETALKAARRWGYRTKNIPQDKAEIVCFDGNFHGRTTTIISFSQSEDGRKGFGPFTPGFRIAPYGDSKALQAAINPNTAAVLLEPIQGEGGVIIPPDGFLRQVRELRSAHQVLMVADEIQTGLCRTGALFACDHEQVDPDIIILGKSLAGGVTPLSCIAANDNVMSVFEPGSHGSTFGGNALACAISREVIKLIHEEKPEQRSKELGAWFADELRGLKSKYIRELRARGLFIGLDIDPAYGPAKIFCKKLMQEGLLCKDTRDQTIRFAPPLIIGREQLEEALVGIRRVFVGSAGILPA